MGPGEWTILGYLGIILMGITMGLMGSGGSTLTVPILVLLFAVRPGHAVGYSLFIVGVTALAGTLRHYRKGHIDIRAALAFGGPSVLAVYSMRRYVVPSIPDPLSIAGAEIAKDAVVLLLFGLLMIASSLSMIRAKVIDRAEGRSSLARLAAYGVGVGIVTGSVGAGGGFLIVPALVLILNLDMRTAVPTSLAIIGANSMIGFVGEWHAGQFIAWPLVLSLTALATIGLVLGSKGVDLVPSDRLRPAFGYFILAMGGVTLWQAFHAPTA